MTTTDPDKKSKLGENLYQQRMEYLRDELDNLAAVNMEHARSLTEIQENLRRLTESVEKSWKSLQLIRKELAEIRADFFAEEVYTN